MLSIDLLLVIQYWSGSHQAHIALENIPELGHLVNAESAEKLSNTCNPGIFFEFLIPVPFHLGIWIFAKVCRKNFICIIVHCPEFIHDENFALSPEAHLLVKNATW